MKQMSAIIISIRPMVYNALFLQDRIQDIEGESPKTSSDLLKWKEKSVSEAWFIVGTDFSVCTSHLWEIPLLIICEDLERFKEEQKKSIIFNRCFLSKSEPSLLSLTGNKARYRSRETDLSSVKSRARQYVCGDKEKAGWGNTT